VVAAVEVGDVEGWDADLSAVAQGLGVVVRPPGAEADVRVADTGPAGGRGEKELLGMSEYAGLPSPKRFQHLLNAAFAVPVDLPLVDVRGTALRPDVVLAATRDGDWERRSCGHGGHVTPDGVEDPAAGLPCPDGGETGSDPVDLAEGVVVDGREPELREPARGSRAHVSKAVPAVHDHRPGPVENR
jgi:hypothetical protein